MNHGRRRAGGFTLLEAIVALTILGVVMIGAWTWIGNGMRALGKVQRLALEETAIDAAFGVLEQQDFGAVASGDIDWQDYRIGWSAAPALPAREGRTSVGGVGRHRFTLYDVDLAIYHAGTLIATPRVRMLRHARKQADADDAGGGP